MRVTDIYSGFAADYELHWGPQLAARRRILIDGMLVADAERVLDLGAGVG